jgi:VWFA-related protein
MNPKTRTLRRLAGALLLALPRAAALAAEPGAPASEGPPTLPRARPEQVTSELVLIETYVTDLKGRALRGLGPESFVLMIDGKIAPIASFEFREIGPDAARGASPDAPGDRAPDPAVEAPPRRFLLFFEDDTSSPHGLTAARRAAAEFIATRLLPTDQVALVARGRTLRPLSDFTADRSSLLRRLEESLHDPTRVSSFYADLRDREQELRRVAGEQGLFRHLFASYAAQDALRYQKAISALRATIDTLAPWPGYKALIFLGDGIPDNPGRYYLERLRDAPGLQETFHELHAVARKADLSFEVKSLIDAAGAARVTLHTIATGGLVVDTDGSLPPQTGRYGARVYGGGVAATLADSVRADSLKTIAFNTGGVSSHSNNALQGLREAEASSRAYYVLGYAPEGPPDGRTHTVQVRLRKVTARLSWRRGFTRLLPEEARARAVQAAHLLPELYALGALELLLIPGPVEGPGRIADLVLYLPPGQVLFLPREGRLAAGLEIGLTILDGRGRETLRLARKVRIEDSGEGTRSSRLGLNFVLRLWLPDDAQSVTAVIEDRGSRALLAARLQVPEARPDEAPLPGLSIYSRRDSSLWVEMESSPAAPEEEERTLHARVGPALKSTFGVGEPLLCGFRLRGRKGGAGRGLRLVIRSAGERLREVGVETGAEQELVKQPLPVEGLGAGEYRLEVEEAATMGPSGRGGLAFRLAAPQRAASPRPQIPGR